MNRLWVRLSIVIGGIGLLAALLPLITFLTITWAYNTGVLNEPSPRPEPTPIVAPNGNITVAPAGLSPARPPRGRFNPWRDIPENMLRSFVVASFFGIIGGIAASRMLSAPITKLANAVHAIGAGNLSTRVDIGEHSREIDELTAAFNKMATDLQRAAELRNNLMADVSHELRTPLTVLEGNLRAALDHVYELDDEQIANLYEQTRHLIRLVNELRELALAEAAQLPLDQEPVDLTDLIEETVAVFEPLAEEKHVHLRAETAVDLPLVLGDRSRLRQVMHNLLANALRHTERDGRVTVRGANGIDGITIAIQDTGEGMEPEQLRHVFDRFYRTDPSRSRESGGSGLGLAIVKAIVEAHSGKVGVTSAGLGQGSTFTVTLPAA
ncbi:MAG: ATP-binding protein [Caldilineaceae bacterium]